MKTLDCCHCKSSPTAGLRKSTTSSTKIANGQRVSACTSGYYEEENDEREAVFSNNNNNNNNNYIYDYNYFVGNRYQNQQQQFKSMKKSRFFPISKSCLKLTKKIKMEQLRNRAKARSSYDLERENEVANAIESQCQWSSTSSSELLKRRNSYLSALSRDKSTSFIVNLLKNKKNELPAAREKKSPVNEMSFLPSPDQPTSRDSHVLLGRHSNTETFLMKNYEATSPQQFNGDNNRDAARDNSEDGISFRRHNIHMWQKIARYLDRITLIFCATLATVIPGILFLPLIYFDDRCLSNDEQQRQQ